MSRVAHSIWQLLSFRKRYRQCTLGITQDSAVCCVCHQPMQGNEHALAVRAADTQAWRLRSAAMSALMTTSPRRGITSPL